MTTEQVIKNEIKILLSESELAEETINTILEWVLIRNILGKESFLWAQLVSTIGNAICDTPCAILPGAVAMETYPAMNWIVYDYLNLNLDDCGTTIYTGITRGGSSWGFYVTNKILGPSNINLY